MAYTNVLNESIGGDTSDLKTFSIEIALRLLYVLFSQYASMPSLRNASPIFFLTTPTGRGLLFSIQRRKSNLFWGQFPEARFVLEWVSVIDTSQLAAG
jgi:hypothetical protein